jgi:hypothetical protein
VVFRQIIIMEVMEDRDILVTYLELIHLMPVVEAVEHTLLAEWGEQLRLAEGQEIVDRLAVVAQEQLILVAAVGVPVVGSQEVLVDQGL